MLIGPIVPWTRFTYTGVNTFPVDFPFYGLESIKVQASNNDLSNLVLIDLIFSLDYSVTGTKDSGDDSLEAYVDGTVTLTAAGVAKLVNGYTVAVYRETVIEQEYQYNELDNFPAKSHENALGRLTVEAQELAAKFNRALVLNPSSTQNPDDVIIDIVGAKDGAVAAAADAKDSALEASSAATTAELSSTDANLAKELARQWAENPENIPVAGTANGFSSYHWSLQAQQIAIGDIPIANPTSKGLVSGGGQPGQVYKVNTFGTAYAWEDLQQLTFATEAETIDGVITDKATMPAGVKAAIDSAIASLPVPATVPSGVVAMWYGTIAAIPSGWALCNGLNGTPDLQDKFVIGAGSKALGSVGGSSKTESTILTVNQIPVHSHTYTAPGYVQYAGAGSGAPGYSLAIGGGTGTAGGGQGHDHEFTPPYCALYYIMKL